MIDLYKAQLARSKRTQKTIAKQIAVIEKLLVEDGLVNPPGCNCAIKSRYLVDHATNCPWRLLTEILPTLRLASNSGAQHD